MSLSSLLESDKELVAYLRQLASKPKLPVPAPQLVAPPCTKNYGLVGTACDYLLRWRLQHANPGAISRRWVAQAGVQRLPPTLRPRGAELLKEAKACHARFLRDGELTDDLLVAAIGLAQLDTVFRSGRGFAEVGTPPHPADVEDLRAQWAAVPAGLVRGHHACMLNPTFGVASQVVGGADADLILDDMLVDVKSSKNFVLERFAFDQLLGYVLLARIGGIDDAPMGDLTIKRVGIYFSRYGVLVSWSLADIVPEQALRQAMAWLQGHLPPLTLVDELDAGRRKSPRPSKWRRRLNPRQKKK